MLKKHEQLRIHDLVDSGLSVAEIAMRTGKSLGTIYKYKSIGRQLQGRSPREAKITPEIEPYVGLIDESLKNRKLKFKNLLFKIQQAGYKGPNAQTENYVRERKQQIQSKKYLTHVESGKGEQAQVDWGHFGIMIIDGRPEKVYLFAYILSYSRACFFEFVVRQNQRTLHDCHTHAFEALGIPRSIVYDNMKTVVSHRKKLADGGVEINYNVAFMDFARYYQFEALACPPYWPRAKGKVESSIKYVRHYFPRISPNQSFTLEELNNRFSEWISTTANERIHGTTRQKPSERWLEEKPYLKFPTNLPPYSSSPLQVYYTTKDGLLLKNGNTYKLGPAFVRQKLEVRELQEHGWPSLEIYRHNELIGTAPVPSQKHSWVTAILVSENNLTESTKKKPFYNRLRR